MNPRNALEVTRALGQMRKSFFNAHLLSRLRSGPDRDVGTAYDVFEGEALQRLSHEISEAALHTPVVITDLLSDRLLAAHITERDGTMFVAVNARFKMDAETLLHTVAEEYAHSQQVLDGVDFASQKRRYIYSERPYEIEAKRIATMTLGYEPEDYEVLLWRPEPVGVLYDNVSIS